MTDRFVTVPDSLELPAAVKVPVARLVGPTGAAAAPADIGAATAAQGALADATTVEQVTLTASLAYTLPVGTPAGVVHRVVFTQTTGGHTVTYGGQPVTVDLTAGASTTVDLHPVGAGYAIRYPVTDLDAQVSALAEDGGSALSASLSSTYATTAQGAKADTAVQRTPSGAVRVGDAAAADEAVSLGQAVTSEQVRRMIFSSDPDTPLEAGDVLFVYEEPRFFTDFPGGLAEVTQPWVSGAWTAESGVAGASGLVLRKPSTATARRALRITEAGLAIDAEVVARMRPVEAPVAGLIHCGIVLRGSGAQGSEQGVYVGTTTIGLYVGHWIGGVGTALYAGAPGFNFTEGQWGWLRIRATGTTVQAKGWADGDPEPSGWAASVTTAVTDEGWIGILGSASPAQDFDLVGVGYDGRTAPTEAV